jgi:hypothetical protein
MARLILLLVAAAVAKPAEVPLTFAWPAGLDLPVSVDVREVITAGSEARRRCFSLTTRLHTAAAPEGLRVSFDPPQDHIPADQCPQFVELRPLVPPPFVVGADTEILTVEGEPARETRELWNRVVASWSHRTVSAEPEAVRLTRALPSLSWEPNDVAITTALTDRRHKDTEVELTTTFVPDPADVTDYFRRLHASAPELGGEVGSASLTEEVRLRVDPRTLLPTRWSDSRTVVVRMAEPPGTATRVVETVWTFEEPDRPRRSRGGILAPPPESP